MLELGSSSTGPIVEKSGAASSKIYEVLEKLMQKGLVSVVIKSGVKHYESASPKRILDYLKEKQQTIEEQTKNVEALLPELEMKQTLSKNKSETLVFKGLKGAQTAFDNILHKCNKGDELIALGFSDVDETFQNFLIRFHKRRVKHGSKFRAVFGPSLGPMVKILNNLPGTKVKVIPQMGNTVATLVYKDTVLFSMAKDRLWIQVQNQGLADTMLERFENVWDQKVQVFQGKEALKNLFWQSLDFGDYSAFAEGMKIVNTLGDDFFVRWQNEKRKRKIHSKIIMGDQYKNTLTVTGSYAEFKFIPGYENVGATLIFKEKVIQVNFTENPTAFLIEDKDSADSQRIHFEQLWNQDTTVSKGFDELLVTLNSFVDDIQKGDTFDVLGAAFGVKSKNEKYAKLFTEFHKHRQKKNVYARWLFQQGTNKLIGQNQPNYQKGEMKFLPYKNTSPVNIYPYKDKTLIVLQGEEPTVITINNKEITQAFHKQFELQWEQEIFVAKGVDAVQDIFEDMLNYGSCDFIGARGYFMDHKSKWIQDYWVPKAKKLGFTMRNVVDSSASGHLITKLPFVETRYNLSKEFSDLAVFWIYGNKVVISNWVGEEPIVTVMNLPRMNKVYKKQFESLWNQRTITLEGEAAAEHFLNDMLNYKEVWFIGGNDGITRYHPKLWKEFNQKRIKNKIFWHDLIDAKLIANLFEGEDRSKVKYYEYKVLPPELSSPHVIALYGNKVANIIWSKNTIITITEDKQIFDGYRKYFDYLWDQDTTQHQGVNNMEAIFFDALASCKNGDETYVYGASTTSKESDELFYRYNKARAAKGVKLKILFHESAKNSKTTRSAIKAYNPLAEIKFTKNFVGPAVFEIFPDRVIISTAAKKNLRCTVIKDLDLVESFKANFFNIWKNAK